MPRRSARLKNKNVDKLPTVPANITTEKSGTDESSNETKQNCASVAKDIFVVDQNKYIATLHDVERVDASAEKHCQPNIESNEESDSDIESLANMFTNSVANRLQAKKCSIGHVVPNTLNDIHDLDSM